MSEKFSAFRTFVLTDGKPKAVYHKLSKPVTVCGLSHFLVALNRSRLHPGAIVGTKFSGVGTFGAPNV